MNSELLPNHQETKKPSITLPFPTSWWGRALYGLFIVTLPFVSFVAVFYASSPDWWQSGEIYTYVTLMLSPEASLLFFILLAYSIICYLLLLTTPTRYVHSFIIRMGIYTGVLLFLQYSVLGIILIISLAGTNWLLYHPVLVWVSLLILLNVYKWATTKWGYRTINILFAVLIVSGYIILSVTNQLSGSAVFDGFLFVAPLWYFLIIFQTTLWLIKNYETKLTFPRVGGVGVWLSAYVAAWRFDIMKMYEIYASLPGHKPWDCYIATAAARGHPRFVGSEEVILINEKTIFVNRQLQILKCAELALLVISPKAHQVMRRIYDKLGRPLAPRIRNPFVADVAYLLLKPCELLAIMILKLILPDFEAISRKMYKTI